MDLALVIFLFLLGIVFIIKGGDYFVDAAAWMAEVSGIPKLIVGATIVSLATTLPEMLVSVMAAAKSAMSAEAADMVDMAVGNAVGSVTANIGLIMAISLLCLPGVIKRSDYLMKSILMLSSAGVIVAAGLSGQISMPFSIVLLLIFCIFIWENVSSAMSSVKARGEGGKRRSWKDVPQKELTLNLVKFVVGTIGIVWGADLLVDNGSELARLSGISERIIGVTVIAVGTSLPELITTVSAIVKKQSSLSLGNILGANIIDLTLILPLSGLVAGKAIPITATSANFDLPACLLVGCVALVPAMISEKFRRWQGAALLAIYAGYVFLTCTAVSGV